MLLFYLVKVLETLNEVVYGVPDWLAGDVLQHGQEHLECHPGVLLVLLREKTSLFMQKSLCRMVLNEHLAAMTGDNDTRRRALTDQSEVWRPTNQRSGETRADVSKLTPCNKR